MFISTYFLFLISPSWQLVLQDGSRRILAGEPRWIDESRLVFQQDEQTFCVHKRLILRLEPVRLSLAEPTPGFEPARSAIPFQTLPQPVKPVVVDDSILERYSMSHVWVVPQCLALPTESEEALPARDEEKEKSEQKQGAAPYELKIAASRKRIGGLEDQIDLLKLKLRDSIEVDYRARLHETLVVTQKKWRREVDLLGALVTLAKKEQQGSTP